METPASIHSFSTRPFPERIPRFDWCYYESFKSNAKCGYQMEVLLL